MKALLMLGFLVMLAGLGANELLVGVGQDYESIKLAMVAAEDGDTITVGDGNYIGRVIVDKEVTIRSLNGSEYTFVQADTLWASPFDVYADNVTVDGFSVYGASSAPGISIKGAAGVQILNCRSGWDPSHTNKVGIQLFSHEGIYPHQNVISGNTCSYNTEGGIYLVGNYHLVQSNICDHNQSPIYSGIYGIATYAGEGCTIKGNQCRYNDIGLRYYYNSAMDAVVDNQLNSNDEYGIHAYHQGYLSIAGNQILDNGQAGIYLSGVHSSMFWSNELSDNTVGVDARYCQELGFYLNSFSDVTKFVHQGNSSFSYRSPTKLCYVYNYNVHKGWMGNFYNDYPGEDEDGNGIGDSTYDLGDCVDTMPLIVGRDQFNLQVWFLHDLLMYRDSEIESTQQHYLQGDGNSHIWIADGAVVDGISYPAGVLADQTTWTGMFFHYNFDLYDFTVEIGYWDGIQFNPGGPEETISYRNGRQIRYFNSSEAAFVIPGGSSLAVRLTVNNINLHRFVTGAAWSYITAPIGSPEYIDYDSSIDSPSVRISHVASPEFNYVYLEWDPVPGALAYNVYSRDIPYGAFTLEPSGTAVETLSWTDFDESSSRKFYKVTALN